MNKEALLEAVKEFFRVMVLAVIPVVIGSLESGLFDWKIVVTVGAIAGLRFVDKLLHEVGKDQSTKKVESKLVGGLTRF